MIDSKNQRGEIIRTVEKKIKNGWQDTVYAHKRSFWLGNDRGKRSDGRRQLESRNLRSLNVTKSWISDTRRVGKEKGEKKRLGALPKSEKKVAWKGAFEQFSHNTGVRGKNIVGWEGGVFHIECRSEARLG